MILVTGITGLTGRFLYEELKKTDLKVKYLVRKTSDISWMHPDDNIVFGELKNVDEVVAATEDVDSILHLAPRNQLQNIISACTSNKIQRIFYVNSTGIYSKFKSSSHIDIKNEESLKKSGLTYTIIRPTMIYGNHQDGNIQKLVKIMKRTPVFPILGEGYGLMHPIYAEDLAKVLVSALMKEELTRFKEYDVAGKQALTYRSLLKNISRALDKKVLFIHIPYRLALLAGKIGDKIPNKLIDYEKVLRLVEDKNFDYSLAKKDLGFDPIHFEEGIIFEIRDLREKGII